MNGDEALARIRDAMREKANETQSVQKLIDKINSGKAGFQDTELYARWAAVNLGLCLSDAVCKIDLQDRPAVCRALLLDQYEDLNGFLGLVQQELDSRFGIRIAPQRAPFPETRVQKLGNSLTDRTVPDATIERRARSGAENVTNALHDDYMKANAEFRDRAGMTSYIIRDGSAKCCDWCADVSGKYTLDSAPAGIWDRHDNCKCSILYESKRSGRQLLRGTSKKWEVAAEGAGAGELHRLSGAEAAAAGAQDPVVFTKEQAEKLQAEKGLTILPRNDTINLEAKSFYSELVESGEFSYHDDGTMVVTDDWKSKGKVTIPKLYNPYAVIESVTSFRDGTVQIDRSLYNSEGVLSVQIHSADHHKPKQHPFGIHGEHHHYYTWTDGQEHPNRTTDELTDQERKEHGDLL